jgi:predicted DNA-binding transcriptional regulator YafY
MKQMDRRLLILTRLRAERPVRALDLAEDCECSVRTIYRDIEALSYAGVPVAAQPGEGYRLAPGYHLPPIAFTAEEAAQLLRGTEFTAGLGTSDHESARRAAVTKLEAALPPSTLAEVARLRDRVRIESAGHEEPSTWLGPLLRAVLDQHVIQLRYHSFGSDELTDRTVEPHHLSYYAGDWHLRAHCRLREGGRDFRLARIQHAEVTSEVFDRRPELDCEPPDFFGPGDPIEVRVWLDASVVPWAREQTEFGFSHEEPSEGGTTFVFNARDLRRLLPWILRWGASARVLSPPEVVATLRDEAAALLRAYDA